MRRLTSLSFSLGAVSGVPHARAVAAACALGIAASLVGCSGASSPTSGGGAGGGAGGSTQQGAAGSTATGETHGDLGTSDFVSAPPGGSSSGSGTLTAGAASGAAEDTSAPAVSNTSSTRTVEETDIYRFDAATNRLYYLNAYRGLMVFDVTNVDAPQMLGRAPIFGDPVEMVVRNGIVAVIVGDWYGTAADGTPFHGSVVRGYDTSDPTNIKQVGEAPLDGWVRDSRVVADPNSPSGVLYMVSEDYGWSYSFDTSTGVYSSTSSASSVVVSSVSFGPTGVSKVDEKRFGSTTGYCYWGGAIFNVTNESVLLAHAHGLGASDAGGYTACQAPTQTDLEYLDITDPNGAIRARGTITVNGIAQGWGADNGRWNLDFADKVHAHVIGCASQNGYCYGSSGDNYVLETADFTNPDAPTLSSELRVASPGWAVTARFDSNRMYLSPSSDSQSDTPVRIYDLSTPTAPSLAGETSIPGSVWLFMPSGQQIFALGQQYGTSTDKYYTSSQVSLSYLDVANASTPAVIGTASFGDGWAWTPAAGTFKAFTKDESQGLVVLPFSSWSSTDSSYFDGLQLIEFKAPAAGQAGSIKTSGTARTKGWVERGIFVKNRLVSLSDLSLAVIDYTDHANPVTVKELTLARNVVDATPQSQTIAELSSDWWGNDTSTSSLRIRSLSDAEEKLLDTSSPEAKIPGVYARAFHSADGKLAYIVTDVPCSGGSGSCSGWGQRVQVVDESLSTPALLGAVELPASPNWYYWWDNWGWYGFWYYDWFNGNNVVQVGDHTLAFRRWGYYGGNYDEATNSLYVVDMSDPNKPTVASTTITKDTTAWWGNMRAVGNTLYTTHYEWYTVEDGKDSADGGNASTGVTRSYAKYYLDRIDLTDPAHPVVGSRINVPGILVGANDSDPTVLYTMDYFWGSDGAVHDQLAIVKVQGDKAYLQSTLPLEGYVGRVLTQNDRAYMSVQSSGQDDAGAYWTRMQLHQIDMSDPKNPVDSVSAARGGWGWLLDVAGDRAFLRSGWGDSGLDIYKLSADAPPAFDKFVRTRGWNASSLKRQGDSVYVATGYWGVQEIPLK